MASAFDHHDVDALYDESIVPTLREMGIMPLRVDRVEHNDDIDDKIVESIAMCDLCIADLTYARPSVYYEAGRVEGLGKPVVFTAHESHFRPSPEDAHGNRRVHFDLQMRNIIRWSRPSQEFSKRLRRRLHKVMAPLLDAKLSKEKARQDEVEFREKPQKERIEKCINICAEVLAEKGWEVEAYMPHVFGPDPGALGVRTIGGGVRLFGCIVWPSFKTKWLEGLIWKIPCLSMWDSQQEYERLVKGKKILSTELVLISQIATQRSKIENIFDTYSVESTGSKDASTVYRAVKKTGSGSKHRTQVGLHTMHVRSFNDLREKLNSITK